MVHKESTRQNLSYEHVVLDNIFNGSGVMALYRFFKFQFQLAQIRTFDIPLERSARADLENVYVQGSTPTVIELWSVKVLRVWSLIMVRHF